MNKEELEKIKQKALEEHIPIIMDDTLEVVDRILKEVQPKRILEIGTAVGYSAMCFSEYLQGDGKIDTIERDEERIAEAKVNIKNVGVEDKINIYEASRQGMLRATNSLKVKPDYIITDAMPLDGFTNVPHEAIIKGDAKSITIAAASVIAKVTRDRLMYEIDKMHPEYEFKKHKGYPTKKHIELIEKYGIINGYRRTYGPVKKYIEEHKNK